MDELPTRVSALLAQAREGEAPEDADRARVHASLMAAIGAPAPPAATGTDTGTSSAGAGAGGALASGALLKWGGLLLASALAGAVIATQPWREAPTPATDGASPGAERSQPVASHATEQAPVAPATAGPRDPAGEAEPPDEGAGAIAQPAEPAEGTDRELHPADPAEPVGEARAARVAAAPGRRHTVARAKQARSTAVEPAPVELGAPVESEHDKPEHDQQQATSAERALPTPEAQPQPDQASTPSSGRRELSLIQSATRALAVGEPKRALQLLTEHGRDFPSGVLAQERDGLRVLTLCKLGRVPEGRREQARFLAAQPESPLSARVRAACGGEIP